MHTKTGAVLFAVLGSVLVILSFPDFGFYYLGYIAIVPLILLSRFKTGWHSFLYGWAGGFVTFLGLSYWLIGSISTYGGLPLPVAICGWILLSLYAGASYGLFVFLLSKSTLPIYICAPVIWVAIEYLRATVLTGFPLGLLGYSQYHISSVIQVAEFAGVYGVSFFMLIVNSLLAGAILALTQKGVYGDRKLATRLLVCIPILFLVITGFSEVRLSRLSLTGEGATIGIIQGNVDQAAKWSPDYRLATIKKYMKLSRKAAKRGAKLLIWPETAMPFLFDRDQFAQGELKRFASAEQVNIVFGAPAVSIRSSQENLKLNNSAFFISDDGVQKGRYDKVHLVPFGEYVPLQSILFFLGRLVEAVGDFLPGEGFPVINGAGTNFGILICYEMIFPELVREYAMQEVQFIATITNDAWFGNTSAPLQLFSMGVFRSVESRLPLVRSANTGISGVIGSTGEILQESSLFKEEVIVTRLPGHGRDKTFYTLYGDIFAQVCVILAIACGLFAGRKQKNGVQYVK